LEFLGFAERSVGDLESAIRSFEALIESAAADGEGAAEVRAMLHLASVLFLGETERCLQLASLAAQLSEKSGDERLQARAQAQYAGHYLGWKPWEEERFQIWTRAIEYLRRVGDTAGLCQHLGYYALSQCHRSEYRAASRLAEEGMLLTQEAGDGFQYVVCQYSLAKSLLHLGAWGRLLEVVQDGERHTELNGHRYGQLFFQLLRAWLHIQAFSFAEAARLSDAVCIEARASADLRYPLFFGLLLDGMALLGAGRPGEASGRFAEIQDRLVRGEHMHWNLHLPLCQALAECALLQGDLELARLQGERLCELAARPRERAYLATGHGLLAEIALRTQERNHAQAAVARALAALDGAEALPVAWRTHALAARIYELGGAQTKANRAWLQSAALISELKDSLGATEPLRDTFLAAEPVRTVLTHAMA
jgi:hypothetical protein